MIDLRNISFDYCIKCTVCTVYCPVTRATHLFPGPKQSGPDTERLRIKNPSLIDASLNYCNNCKRCEIACPSDVKIADIIQRSKAKYLKNKIRLRDFILSHTDMVGRISVFFSFIINKIMQLPPVRIVMDVILKIPRQRKLPGYEHTTFEKWFKTHAPDQSRFTEKVVYFHGCYVNYNDHTLGKAMIQVLNAMNTGVILTREKCCGVPYIANGFIDKARINAEFNIDSLTKTVSQTDMTVVLSSSTCALALTHEYPNLLGMDNISILNRIEYITQFIYTCFSNGNMPKMKPLPLTCVYHSPCHLERMGGAMYTIGILNKIPGLKLILLHSECCGIAGTYGFKKEYYKISQDIGTDLFQKINQVKPDMIVTDCETCKWQFEMNTDFRVVHPITLLSMALSE